jgi:ribosome-associated toxin RatA of RatAB toxin-antitoxin module
MVFGLLAAAPDGASAPSAASRVDVTETGGVYDVAASFAVSEMPHVVMAVLTDYERIPKFMPDMEISKIVERTATGMVVEQQAVSKFMLFSKRVHLMLEVSATDGRIHFRDRCGESFSAYEGSWIISQHDTLTVVDYQLSARPTFDVPAFVLKRLLKRDSIQMIDRIKLEIAGRADRAR